MDPASTRFQGRWEGKEVFLGVSGDNTVNIITGVEGESEGWGAGRSVGNTVLGFSNADEVSLQYLPQGSDTPPEGWSALSDWVIVLD